MVCGVSGVTGPAVWLEGSGLLGPYQYSTTVYGQSRHWLSNIRHVFDILPAPVGHPVPILEDFQNSQEKDSQKKSSEKRYARTLQVRNKILIIHFLQKLLYIQKKKRYVHGRLREKYKYTLPTQKPYVFFFFFSQLRIIVLFIVTTLIVIHWLTRLIEAHCML